LAISLGTKDIYTESIMGDDLMAMMVSANVCRALPPATDEFDPKEDEPVLEPMPICLLRANKS
jgi:serine/threonine-protein phosphatase 2A regulatory subunit B'